jgi:hypothetical protein
MIPATTAMKSVLKHLPLAVALVAATAAPAAATEPAIIAEARAFLGSEATLNGVNSLHFYGTLDLGAEAATTQPIKVEIFFERPFRQRSVITSERGTEVTVLDGYDAWQRVNPAGDDSRWNLSVLQAQQIKNLRANVWQNLSFFRGIDQVGGRIDDLGTVTVDGQSCRKLAFVHDPEIIFYRYFSEATGQLIMTETLRGETIRESGSMQVGGIRFPQVLTTETTRPDGTTQTVRIQFDKVEVNQPAPAGAFDVPLLISK